MQVTVVFPRGKIEPEGGSHVTITGPSTLSIAPAAKVTTAPSGPVASAVMSLGAVITGGVVSRTMILKEPVAMLPWASVGVQAILFSPSAKLDPEVGLQITPTARSTMSAAVGG